jgi:hypothetical protein
MYFRLLEALKMADEPMRVSLLIYTETVLISADARL